MMYSPLRRILGLYVFWLLTFVVEKPLFMVWYRGLYEGCSLTEWLQVVTHGLPLDFSMAGYLVSLPLLLVLTGIWLRWKWLRGVVRLWIALAAFLVAASFVLNAVLYEYWGFPLDSTPLFYFFSSPKDALASAGRAQAAGGMLAVGVLAWLLYTGACWAFGLKTFLRAGHKPTNRRLAASGWLVLLGGLLFVAIRGGVTVSSMNTGKAYFSQLQPLNHAAVNPLFCLMESMAHQNDFGSQYRFLDDAQASRLFADMTKPGLGQTEPILTTTRPDIYLVILESFSAKLLKTLGGNGVAVSLDTLSQESVFFTRFYANSFRTDRGLVSILSGYPAQPTMSLMKYPHKTASLPSIAAALKAVGYELDYYYGGDANFTHMRSYLVGQGFESIVSDVSFPVKDRLSKWGVPDHLVFERLMSDVQASAGSSKPHFRVLQTSSSHEPFDVPFHRLNDERLNAFAYTDDCLGRFVAELRHTQAWKNALVVVVPDHLGAYPVGISNLAVDRYHIPMLMLGGAVAAPRQIDVVGSQQDMAATLLAQMGIDHSDFLFSKDLLDASAPHFAFFTVPDAFGIVTQGGHFVFDNRMGSVVTSAGDGTQWVDFGKAYLQKLYDDINQR